MADDTKFDFGTSDVLVLVCFSNFWLVKSSELTNRHAERSHRVKSKLLKDTYTAEQYRVFVIYIQSKVGFE